MTDRFELRATPAAERAITALRGRAGEQYARLEADLRAQGCKAAGYRLLAGDAPGYSEYCCKHLSDDWRVVVRFEPGVVIIVAVGQHDGDAFYGSLADLGIAGVGQRRDEKPACCGDDGWPTLGETRAERRGAA